MLKLYKLEGGRGGIERLFSLYKVGFEGRRHRFPSLLDCTLIAARIAAMNYFHVALIVPHICEIPNHVESSKQYTRDSGQATWTWF